MYLIFLKKLQVYYIFMKFIQNYFQFIFQYRNSGNPLAHYDGTAMEILDQCDGMYKTVLLIFVVLFFDFVARFKI